MSEYGLPCIVCGRELRNWNPDGYNEPNDAVVATTTGNYGSTVWDSFTGEFLEFNICDDCLKRAGDQGRVFVARTRMPVTFGGFRVGSAPADYIPVPWTSATEPDDRQVALWDEELDDPPAEYSIDQRALADARRVDESGTP